MLLRSGLWSEVGVGWNEVSVHYRLLQNSLFFLLQKIARLCSGSIFGELQDIFGTCSDVPTDYSLEFLNRNTKSESSNPIYYTQIGAPATLAVLIIKTMTLIGLIYQSESDRYLSCYYITDEHICLVTTACAIRAVSWTLTSFFCACDQSTELP